MRVPRSSGPMYVTIIVHACCSIRQPQETSNLHCVSCGTAQSAPQDLAGPPHSLPSLSVHDTRLLSPLTGFVYTHGPMKQQHPAEKVAAWRRLGRIPLPHSAVSMCLTVCKVYRCRENCPYVPNRTYALEHVQHWLSPTLVPRSRYFRHARSPSLAVVIASTESTSASCRINS